MFILSPRSKGLVEGIPWTMHSLTDTHTDFGKRINPIGVGYALCDTRLSNTKRSMSY